MDKQFKIEMNVKVHFLNIGDYYDEIPKDFETIKNDVINGSRSLNYSLEINKEETIITEI
jgi:hypothetical protein